MTGRMTPRATLLLIGTVRRRHRSHAEAAVARSARPARPSPAARTQRASPGLG